MLPEPPFRLPPALERATQRVRQAAQQAAAQTVDSLGLAALAAPQLLQRDALLGAQYELGRKTGLFAASFNESLDQAVARGAGLLQPTSRPMPTPDQLVATWESLSLVDNDELELYISADRFALALSHACDWELRELDAYVATLLGLDAADHARNPLRAEVVAQALMRAVDSLSGRPEVRQVLATHLGRSLSLTLRQAYAEIVTELRGAGVRPAGLAVRQMGGRPGTSTGSSTSGTGSTNAGAGTDSVQPSSRTGSPPTVPGAGPDTAPDTGQGAAPDTAPPSALVSASGHGRTRLGAVPSDMMGLLRDLARQSWSATASAPPFADLDAGTDAATGPVSGSAGGLGAGPATGSGAGTVAALPNLIQAHRAALRDLATGALDHLVIDLVAGLFDQILSDSQVPPPYVRQIARLQLPVLRAALGDPAFFGSRRHPVRRFVNRIASLGTAAGDLESEAGAALLEKVTEAVQAVVQGDFDLAEVYEQQLARLDAFVAEQAQAEVDALGEAGAVLARKEGELARQHRFGRALGEALAELPVPEYLRSFLTETWARAIARAEHKEGADSPLARHLRATGRDLVMSVQPKGSPVHRQHFLRRLPQLMKDLNLGLDHARCPGEARRAFFGHLLPAHALSLKSPPLSTLEHNLLYRRVEAALATPVPVPPPPSAAGGVADPALQAVALDQAFTPAEAHQVGLVTEQAVDWQAVPLDIDLSAEAPLTAVDIALDGLPTPEAPEPTRGTALVDHLQPGMAYQMQLDGRWHRVRLAHVSGSRSFFVFTHGERQRRTVSMTYRMVQRLCEAGRLRALEAAYLLERATARVRRELAALKPAG